nr:translation initiation factor IF-2-like [Anser cygnoides]
MGACPRTCPRGPSRPVATSRPRRARPGNVTAGHGQGMSPQGRPGRLSHPESPVPPLGPRALASPRQDGAESLPSSNGAGATRVCVRERGRGRCRPGGTPRWDAPHAAPAPPAPACPRAEDSALLQGPAMATLLTPPALPVLVLLVLPSWGAAAGTPPGDAEPLEALGALLSSGTGSLPRGAVESLVGTAAARAHCGAGPCGKVSAAPPGRVERQGGRHGSNSGTARRGAARRGVAWRHTAPCCGARHGSARHGLGWHGTAPAAPRRPHAERCPLWHPPRSLLWGRGRRGCRGRRCWVRGSRCPTGCVGGSDPRGGPQVHTALCQAVPSGAVPHGAVLCRAVPCHAVPCHAMPCHAVPCQAVPCRAVPCAACARCVCTPVPGATGTPHSQTRVWGTWGCSVRSAGTVRAPRTPHTPHAHPTCARLCAVGLWVPSGSQGLRVGLGAWRASGGG